MPLYLPCGSMSRVFEIIFAENKPRGREAGQSRRGFGSTGFVAGSRTGTDGRRANESRFGVGGLVCFDRLSTTPAAGSGFRRAYPWGGQRTLSRTHGRERMDGAQMGVASGWVGLSLRRVVGFGGGVRGGKERMKDEG